MQIDLSTLMQILGGGGGGGLSGQFGGGGGLGGQFTRPFQPAPGGGQQTFQPYPGSPPVGGGGGWQDMLQAILGGGGGPMINPGFGGMPYGNDMIMRPLPHQLGPVSGGPARISEDQIPPDILDAMRRAGPTQGYINPEGGGRMAGPGLQGGGASQIARKPAGGPGAGRAPMQRRPAPAGAQPQHGGPQFAPRESRPLWQSQGYGSRSDAMDAWKGSGSGQSLRHFLRMPGKNPRYS